VSLDRLGVSVDYEKGQRFDGGILEGMLEGRQIIEDAAKGPYIDWIGVKLVLYDFRGKIDRSPYSLRDELSGIMDDLVHAQVTDLELPLLSDENVFKFEISMDDA
jgi:hypothetical protein